MSEHEESKKVKEELKDSCKNDEKNQPFLKKMITPSDLNDIQPTSTQVCNCDEIGFDPNQIWNKVMCTYKFFQGERMCKVQTGEQAPFWCTLHVFTRYDGRCFMIPIIVHQAKEYYKDLHFNIPMYWTVHNTPYGYIYRWVA